MSKKKKTIIGIFIIVIILLIIGIILFNLKSNSNKDNQVTENKDTIDYKEEIIITLEDELPNINDYIVKGKLTDFEIKYKIDDEEVSLTELKPGIYTVYINGKKTTTLKIIDNISPELELKELTIKESEEYKVEDFVSKCSDNSKEECILLFKDKEMEKLSKEGTYDIIIIAKDSSNNEIEGNTKLKIKKKESKPTTNQKQETNNTNSINSDNQEHSIVETYKYGTKIITKGSKTTYDYSTFNGTTNDLKAEASSLVSANNLIYNEVLNYTNLYRSEVNVPLLVLDNNLSLGATIRAIEIAYSDTFSHTRPNGSACYTVLEELGFNNYFALGENIAYATYNLSSKNVSEMWRNSQGHYANMIDSSYTKIGIGKYTLGNKTYYVQMFGS